MKLKDYLTILALIIIDQLTKYYIAHTFYLGQKIVVIKDFFCITYATNTGAAFSILEGQQWLFIVIGCAFVIAGIYYLNANAKDITTLEKLSLCLVMSGGVGNLIDRVRFNYVVDFLDFYIFGYDFPIFNVADMCICVGVFFLFISLLRTSKEGL